jgi:hypothetical protein
MEHLASYRASAFVIALGALLLAACGTDDQVLGLRPVPGAEGERVGAREVVLFDDAAALRDHVDEFTVALIVPGERVEELGRDWLADRYADGIVIVALDLPAYDLAELVGAPAPDPGDPERDPLTRDDVDQAEHRLRFGWDEPYYNFRYLPCEESGRLGPGSNAARYAFGTLEINLRGILDRLHRECR